MNYPQFAALNHQEQLALTWQKMRLRLMWGYYGGTQFEAVVARRLMFVRYLYELGRISG